jgi:hypothetical protein
MAKLRKAVGICLAVWGGIRLVVDLLESISATRSYAQSAYLQLASTPSSATLTVAVIATGAVLLLFEPITKLWKEPNGQAHSVPQSLPITDRDPCIIPRYERSPSATAGINNSDWFVLQNEGSVEAYDVTMNEFQTGDTILRFDKKALIHSGKYAMASAELFDIYHGKVPNYGIAIAFNGGWSAWRRETNPPMGARFKRDGRATYRDRANNWFSTEFTMIYDVRKDFIDIDNIKHSRLPTAPPI